MATTVDQHDDPLEVLTAAAGFLERRPAEHNLILSLLHQRARTGEDGRYWVVRHDGDPVGLVLQSPLWFRAALTPMPAEAARAAVEAVAGAGIALPGVEGEAAGAAAFAGHWSQVCRTGARPVLGTRLYRLGALILPEGVAGRSRPAGEKDRRRVREWFAAFALEVGEPALPADLVDRRAQAGQISLWDLDGEVVALAGRTDPVAGVARIGPVYTPPAHRRHGYAAACVGHLSAGLLQAGHSCVLYTQLGNATSNAVYRALGYAPISENVRYEFGAPLET
ncbi:MAG TPA: GNAT family N-acetyltransferase [Acidimicrobiales bacterium]|nr:GNAT family N-acetyltransferase [Acidimicrobiales bacterium]